MEGWKRFSIYHAIKKRRERKFSRDTYLEFFFYLSDDDNLYLPILTIITPIAAGLSFYLSLGFIGWFLISLAFYATVVLILATLDTYNTYKYRVRQNTITSLYKMMEIEVDHWGKPKIKKK